MKFDDKDFIAQIIRKYRKKNQFTQERLAEMVEISNQHLSRIESGCYFPSLKTFFQLADVLKIDLREFGFDKIKTENETKNKLISQIVEADDAKLVLYENILNVINSTLTSNKIYFK